MQTGPIPPCGGQIALATDTVLRLAVLAIVTVVIGPFPAGKALVGVGLQIGFIAVLGRRAVIVVL
jgi:hypothetical protein